MVIFFTIAKNIELFLRILMYTLHLEKKIHNFGLELARSKILGRYPEEHNCLS